LDEFANAERLFNFNFESENLRLFDEANMILWGANSNAVI